MKLQPLRLIRFVIVLALILPAGGYPSARRTAGVETLPQPAQGKVSRYHLNNSGEAVGKIGASQIADLRVNYRRYV